MTAAIQHRTRGPAYPGQSRFFACPRARRHAPRFRTARPEKRLAGPKTAPRKIFSAPSKTRPENTSQTLGLHQENYVWAYDFASGCAVSSNSVTLQRVGEGVGDVTQRTYVVNFATTQSPTSIIENMARNINSYTANRVNPWYESPFTSVQKSSNGDPIFVGNVLKIDGPLFFNPQVQVTGRTENSFTFTTVQGHPEAGTITFSAQQVSRGRVSFVIQSTMQPSSTTNSLLYVIPGIGGRAIQTEIWNGTLQNVVKNSGGSDGVILNRTVNLGPSGK